MDADEPRWHPRPLLAIRIAGLPLSMLEGLDMAESARLVDRLDTAVDETARRRDAAIASLHVLVGGSIDPKLRGIALTLKRHLYNAKRLCVADLERPWPAQIAEQLGSILAGEQHCDAIERQLEEMVEVERRQISRRFCSRLDHPRLLGGVLLSSRQHFEVARGLHALTHDDHHPARRATREAILARYLLRATLRTTPFASFAGVAVLSWDEATRVEEPGSPAWVGVPQLNAGFIGERVLPTLDPEVLKGLSLRVTPLRMLKAEPEPHLLFPHYGVASSPKAPMCEWRQLVLSPFVVHMLETVDGAIARDAIAALASLQLTAEVWWEALDALIAAGVVERRFPSYRPTAAGLSALAAELEARGDSTCYRQLLTISGALKDYADAPIDERPGLYEGFARSLGISELRGCLFEDSLVHGLHASELPLAIDALIEVLEPAADLARASASAGPHRALVHAFCARFGPDGCCDDVPGFITDLLRDAALLRCLREVDTPLPWRDCEALTRALAGTGDEPVQLDRDLFADLAESAGACSIAAFVQFAVRDEHGSSQVEHIVLNGFQSGRDKYLSRYLGDPRLERELLPVARAGFRAAGEPLPVAMHVALGLNFQIHPRLTCWSLDVPFEAGQAGGELLTLDELTLRHDASAQQLRLHAPRLGADVEPIHFGFVRDQLLPDPLLIIRALSPRIADETIAERAAIYATLDAVDLQRGAGLRRFRPRLHIGQLVLERARWAIPVREVPLKQPRESYTGYFIRLERWRRSLGLPRCGFGRCVSQHRYAQDIARSQQYLDWHNPLVVANLRRLLGDARDGRWLLMTELLPTPAQAHLGIEGQRHCSELLVQLDWDRT